ncbi:MAG: (d)CMP kinase [Candidatus Promineifilaceae bacterium]
MTNSHYPQAIAIDGPAASGKTTVGKMLAVALGYLFLDTGFMYRAVTLAVLENNISIDDEAAVFELLTQLDIDVIQADLEKDGRLYTALLNGRDVTWEIRMALVDNNVSQVASYQSVRHNLVKRQRAIASRGRVVMVGRDIGTVVLPEASLKLYITASPAERARRRWQEKVDRGQDTPDYDQILSDIIRRDEIDSSRKFSPMRPADDAILMDTTERPPESIVEDILALPHFSAEQAAARE